ncbi:hypothetical protein GCM10027290_67400 [Micromonospora sonneratiae]|uniref:Class I SAM-dependent methyltransferase n=1 Tax=Micromonospora sonneratiae TaxID=1184706 RepID=A0ABW3YMR9_9ACTN
MRGQQAVPYALNNESSTASKMLDCLSEVLDPTTRQLFEAETLKPNGRYWEVAAGTGSIAGWLCRTLGPTAEVVATDINTRHVQPAPGLEVRRRDDADGPLQGRWDGIHARLALAHWPNRREVVTGYASALAPGGFLLVEDWGPWTGKVLASPVPDAAGIYTRYQNALRKVFDSRGNDSTWAESTAEAMLAAGLASAKTTVNAQTWRGGTPGCILPMLVAAELRYSLIEHGATSEDLDVLTAVMSDPDTYVLGNATWSTIGYASTARA